MATKDFPDFETELANAARNDLEAMARAEKWDCIVIGAGPAGSIAAREVALAGYKVLLVDKDNFPRYKVCGCCLNGAAQDALREAGLSKLLDECGASSLNELVLFDGKKTAAISLSSGRSLSRARFDKELIDAASNSGVTFLPATSAKVLNQIDRRDLVQKREISLKSGNSAALTEASMIIVAEGLAGKSLDHHREFKSAIKPGSRFGAGLVIESGPAFYAPGRIYMACGSGGYVGLVRLEDGKLDIAAAFDQSFSRDSHGPGKAAAQILTACGLTVPDELETAHWTGTQLLTRTRDRIGTERLLVIGDACGYPEPFTGEGIAWALWSGLLSARIAIRGIRHWEPSLLQNWIEINQRFRQQRLRSKLIAQGLRIDPLRRFALDLLTHYPQLASPVVRVINSSAFNNSLVRTDEAQTRTATGSGSNNHEPQNSSDTPAKTDTAKTSDLANSKPDTDLPETAPQTDAKTKIGASV
jgi:menaquinone-9 beta-reductase